MYDQTVDVFFQQRQREIFVNLLPVIIVTVVLAIIGLVGNVLTLVFYVKKSKRTLPNILIKCLASADLATCAVAISLIPEKISNIGYSETYLCKLTHFMGMWAGSSSCLFLWIISIDRYRKICSPLGRQMTISAVKYVAAGIVIFCLLLSSRFLFTYKILEVNATFSNENETITTYYCSIRDDGIYKHVGLAFYLVDFTSYIAILLTIIITYSRIIYKLTKRRKSIASSTTVNFSKVKKSISGKDSFTNVNISNTEGNETHRQAESNDTECVQDKNLEDAIKKTEISIITEAHTKATKLQKETVGTKGSGNHFEFTTAKTPSERNLTIMMFAVSVLFVFCFTPYFVLRIMIRLVLKSDKEHDFSTGIQFALLLPYFNSVFNPIIYSIFNTKFRRFIKSLFLQILTYDRLNVFKER